MSPLSRISISRRAQFELLVFFVVWFTYGTLINSRNLDAFGLQQAGIEAYVARHHLYLEGATDPRLQVQPVVDAFLFNGHIYPAKQPGQFMFGALVYWPIHAAGLTYSRDYLLASAIVTFFTASLIAALSTVLLFRIAAIFAGRESLFWPLLVSIAYALGSTVCAYSGIAWHDTLATGYLVIACYFLVQLSHGSRREKFHALGAGIFLGLSITTSMLAFMIAMALAIYFVTLKRWALALPFAIGGLVGLAPLLIYDMVCFGNPFLLPNAAGNYSDTFFRPTAANLFAKIQFYAKMLVLYVPIAWIGAMGLTLFPKNLRREQLIISLGLLALLGYLVSIEANGTCQYGPRYLLPAMPFLLLGLIGFSFIQGRLATTLAATAIVLLIVISIGINLVGAMHGAMLCDFPHSATQLYLSEMLKGQIGSFPLAKSLLLPLAAVMILLLLTIKSAGRDLKTIGGAP